MVEIGISANVLKDSKLYFRNQLIIVIAAIVRAGVSVT